MSEEVGGCFETVDLCQPFTSSPFPVLFRLTHLHALRINIYSESQFSVQITAHSK